MLPLSGQKHPKIARIYGTETQGPFLAGIFICGVEVAGRNHHLGKVLEDLWCEGLRKRGVDAGSTWRHKPPPAVRFSTSTGPAKDATASAAWFGPVGLVCCGFGFVFSSMRSLKIASVFWKQVR
jgi:hypothetical protein